MDIGGGLYLPDLAGIAAARQKRDTDKYNQNRQQITDDRADQAWDEKIKIGGQVADGDLVGARTQAARTGNFDLIEHLDKMDDRQRQQAASEAEFVARLTPALGQITGTDPASVAAQRKEAARPHLRQQGLTDAQIDAHDFTDNGLALANSAAMTVKDRLAERRADFAEQKPITAADGAVLQPDGKGGYVPIYTPGNKPLTQVVTDPVTGAVRVVSVPGTPGQSTNASPTNAGRVGAGGFENIDGGFTRPTEGGFVARDGASGAPTNFGINQRANPDIDVRNLTPERAAQLRRERYWDKSGAASQATPAAQAIVYDTAVNMGVSASQRMLQETGRDPEKMLAWRESRYRQIAQNPRQASNLPTWLNRNSELRSYVGGGNSSAPQATGNGPTITDLGSAGGGPIWQNDTRNGIQGQTNTRTGEFKPLPGQKAQDASSIQAAGDAITNAETTLRSLYNPATGATHPGFTAAVGSGIDPSSWGKYNPWSGKAFGGTDAADFETQLNTFKSQAFLQSIQQMRGLGALSDAEGSRLTAAIGNLDQNQSEEQFKSNVSNVLRILDGAKSRIAQMRSGGQTQPAQGQPVRVSSPSQAAALPAGTVFITPDGQRRVKH